MIDVTDKPATSRHAVAQSTVRLPAEAFQALKQKNTSKGDALAVAELAGIMAAKRTSDLIPLCHPLPLTSVKVRAELNENNQTVRFTAHCKTTAQTGVEMEAMTAVSIAALTLYDMLKGVSKGILIENTQLLKKEGGKSGLWQRNSA